VCIPLYQSDQIANALIVSQSDFKNGKESLAIHLPLADFTCTGKYVWCGNNEPLSKDVLNAIWDGVDNKFRNPKYMPCIVMWRNSQSNFEMGNFLDECQGVISSKRKFICQLHAT
jgi:hypothetical protein